MKELIDEVVGKQGCIEIEGLKVDVIIRDVKSSYGNIRYLISPIAGSGEVWKEQITINK